MAGERYVGERRALRHFLEELRPLVIAALGADSVLHYRIAEAYCEPRPSPIPPVMIGGHGETYLLRVVARHADWWNYRDDDADYYKQPGDLFRLMTPEQRQALFDNTARAMGDAPDFIKQRHVDNCRKADRAYGAGVEAALRKLGAFAGTNRRGEE